MSKGRNASKKVGNHLRTITATTNVTYALIQVTRVERVILRMTSKGREETCNTKANNVAVKSKNVSYLSTNA